jgi:hypothetical protein
MTTISKQSMEKAVSDALSIPGEKELQQLEDFVRPLGARGFEFRGGDTFGQEVLSIYVNDKLDEYIMLRFNRVAGPPLIRKGPMSELDQPMDNLDSLKFQPLDEFNKAAARNTYNPLPAPLSLLGSLPKPQAPRQ